MSNDSSSSTKIAPVIAGIFTVIAACVAGIFLLTNTLIEQGFIVIGPGVQVGNPQAENTVTPTTQAAMESTTRSTPTASISQAEDCWITVWTFDPNSQGSISSHLTASRSGYSAIYDSGENGSLRLETNKVVQNPLQDPDAWSWMTNVQTIEAKDGLYRLTAQIKTHNAVQSHISIIGRDSFNSDVYQENTNQITRVPLAPPDGTFDWQSHTSLEFNPKEWNSNVQILVVGLNAGWSPDGQTSVTWFDKVELQFCDR